MIATWFIRHPREENVMACLDEGLAYKQIEDRLHISPATLKKAQHAAFVKLEAEGKGKTVAINKWRALKSETSTGLYERLG